MEVTINGIEKKVPQSWNDLGLKQQHTIYQTLFSDTHLLTADALLPGKRLSIAMFLLDIDDDFMESWEQDCIDNYGVQPGKAQFFAEMHELVGVTDFLFDIREQEVEGEEDPALIYSVKLGLTKNPYPSIPGRSTSRLRKRHGKKSNKKNPVNTTLYYGPADELDNLTFYELGVAFTWFEEYLRIQNIDLAIRLIAMLWRPAKPETEDNIMSDYQGDIRRPYANHETTVARRIPIIKALPTGMVQLMLFYFASARQHIIDMHPDIFKAPADENADDASKTDYGRLMLEMAGGVVNLDAVANQNYANVFADMSRLEQARQERELNRKLNTVS